MFEVIINLLPIFDEQKICLKTYLKQEGMEVQIANLICKISCQYMNGNIAEILS